MGAWITYLNNQEIRNGVLFVRDIETIKSTGGQRRMCEFICPDCQNCFMANLALVKNGEKKKCNKCAWRKASTSHGLSKLREYKIWKNIRDRCYNHENISYSNYGGKGITVCDEWLNNPTAFVKYIKELPDQTEKATLDRIRSSDNYRPGNLRWTSKQVQSANQTPKPVNNGFVGVYKPIRHKRYRAQIKINEKYHNIGLYGTALAAVEARDWYIIKNGLWQYPLQVIRKTA